MRIIYIDTVNMSNIIVTLLEAVKTPIPRALDWEIFGMPARVCLSRLRCKLVRVYRKFNYIRYPYANAFVNKFQRF